MPMNVGITIPMRRKTNRNMIALFGIGGTKNVYGGLDRSSTRAAGPFRLVMV
jgi:hypothetical protein